ncbi:hypothetical protein A2W45_01435 [Candidatus Curtissbacteria bacterium RIFCSPHIGHO2_12_41_11]|uniref:DUF4012 domain-containing protein n=3 Tax=Candidatus Curtissiibacteriota TaxID=1752717 RepID=A0A1F5HTE6_9BACT|nr:MAG: hypothetical protein UU56_C0008G0015 [Candidatus Curtissbacteria bacterium GW2011_GWA2_41_24]OGD97982.1 MAG: hypothetical protein A2W45_01435 [Candidatus Curtissbacteria bacterium RIFCSPHIGHO2_12_41_11]OGE07434.1 MAG: hypothetical protein A2W70_03515 [Candidatus Curtissbacteria bacterium RIFCSPLOWO2_02_41_11]
MDQSAQNNNRPTVLITHVDSFLGASLAKFLLSRNCLVYAVGNPPFFKELLKDHDFTLLEFNLNQPLPDYLPNFDLVFYPDLLFGNFKRQFSTLPNLPLATNNIVSLARDGRSRVLVMAPITIDEQIYEYLAQGQDLRKFLKLYLVGDIYGPAMPLEAAKTPQAPNRLADLIVQAMTDDKVILEKEGLQMIYPTYIADVTLAIDKFVFEEAQHQEEYIRVIVSEAPKTALSVAYEIQNAARLILGKELALFFAGSEPQHRVEVEPTIATGDLGFSPKVHLAEGLKQTFEYFANQNLESQPKAYFRPGSHLPAREPADSQTISASRLDEIADLKRDSKIKDRISRLTAKLPKAAFKARLKTGLFFILAILFLTLVKDGFDLYRGATSLKNAQKALVLGNLQEAEVEAKVALKSFNSAAGQTKILLFPVSLIFPSKYQSINLALSGMAVGADSVNYFVRGSRGLVKDLEVITSKDGKTEGLDLETPAVDFRRAYFLSSWAGGLLNLAQEGGIFKSKIAASQSAMLSLNSLSQSALDLVNLVGDFSGNGKPRTYLVLLQNNSELRPGGGFIGNFGLIEFENSHLKGISVEDIYTIDGQLQEEIEPPAQLLKTLGIERFYLRDSNWSGDFEINAATARDFYKKETGKNVDGVIAINLNSIQNVLAKMGPVKLTDYGEEISAQNLFERGEYYSEIGSFPGSTQKKDFFGALSRAIISQIIDSFNQSAKKNSGVVPWLALLEVGSDALARKDLMLTFDSPILSSFVRSGGWDFPLPPASFNPADDSVESRDFLALVEANLGANKVNRFLERKIAYDVTIGRDADLVAKLTITYTNKSQADTWPAGKYVNFLRVYVPLGASLFEYQNADKKDVGEVEVTTQGNLTVFSTMVEVPIKSTREVVFSYRIPKNIKLEKAPYYHLYVQKQAGTEKDPFEFKFNLPAYLTVKSVNGSDEQEGKQNLLLQTDLATDRQFEIEVAKR